MRHITWITDEAAFEALAPEWDALTSADPTPFSDPAWFACWWRAFGAGSRLRVCTATTDGELEAVAPFHERGGRLAAMANFHTPLFRPAARDEEALRAVLSAAMDARPGEVELHAVPADDPTLGAALDASARQHRRALLEDCHVSPIVDTSGDPDAYWRSRKLGDMLRRRRKLEREHRPEYGLTDGSEDLEGELERGFRVEASSWKSRTGTAIQSSPQATTFYTGIARAYRDRGELRLASLTIDGRPAAFNLCLVRARRLYLLKTGFDESLRTSAPGLLLNLWLVERCFELGLHAYELLGAEEQWKAYFATDRRRHVRVRSYRRRPVAVARYLFRRRAVPMLRRAHERYHDLAQRSARRLVGGDGSN
jgi:CelD/BcsL family acetyltransferase involved in cellulose biosynthesis